MPTRSERVSGPRLLLSTTSWPASTASRATVLPMFPLPMSPMVAMYAANTAAPAFFPAGQMTRLSSGTRAPSNQDAMNAPTNAVSSPNTINTLRIAIWCAPNGASKIVQ